MKIGLAAVTLLMAAAPAMADECRYVGDRRVATSAAGVGIVEILAVAGSLNVVGVGGAEIRAHGRACSSEEELIREMQLVLRRSGDRIIVEARIPEWNRWGFGHHYARLDFTVEVPASMAVIIDDSSGSIEVDGVASVAIDDGSGSIDVRRVAGAVSIRDGSGGIDVRDVGGPVRIRDGSGSIVVRQVRADVVIEEDGSGSITIAGVDGDVVIEEDGSGSIDVREVTGSVRVLDDGSGGISVRDVGGDFEVRRDGSGGISFRDVRGRVTIPD
ncbi:MAG TPA: hypothetical protein VMS56_09290 [Thermoanaerobaculia bacterium]|nr:hypothetical protein [Thermoanaerobaculia bacterium]